MHTRTGTHTHTNTYTHLHARTHARTHTHTHTHTHARTHAHTYARTHVRTHARRHTHTQTHTHLQGCKKHTKQTETGPRERLDRDKDQCILFYYQQKRGEKTGRAGWMGGGGRGHWGHQNRIHVAHCRLYSSLNER